MHSLFKSGFTSYKREIFSLMVIATISVISVLFLHLSPTFLLLISFGYVAILLLVNYPFASLLIDMLFMYILIGLSSSLYSGWSYKAFSLLSIIALLINRLYNQKRITIGSPADLLLLSGYIIFLILSSIVNQVTNTLDYVVLILMKYSIVFLIINLIDTRKLLIIYFVGIIAVGTINNIVGIAQVFLGLDWYGFGPRAIGFLINPNGMGYLQSQLIPIIFIVMAQTSNRKIRTLLILLFLLCPIAAILSQSRGAALATFIVMAGIFLVSIRNYYMFVVILVASILIALFWQEPYTERIRNTVERKELLEETRGYLYRAAIVMIMEKPIFGVGPGRFGQEYVNTYASRVNSPSRHSQVPHNGYLEVMTYSGIPGLIFILALIGLWIKRFQSGAKKAKQEGDTSMNQLCRLMIVSIMGYLVVAMFETLTETKNFYYFIGMNIAVTNIIASEYINRSKSGTKDKLNPVINNPCLQASENT